MVVQGTGAVSAATDRVTADLTSAERAGKRAEGAASDAEKAASRADAASRQLSQSVLGVLSRANQLAGILRTAGGAFGIEPTSELGRFLNLGSAAISGAVQGGQFGARFGPVGIAVGGGVGAGLSYVRGKRILDEQAREQNDRLEAERAKVRASERDESLERQVLQAAGLAKLDSLFPPRQVQ